MEKKRQIDEYFDKYAESHQHKLNKTLHWICVPLIVFSLFGLAWSVPFPHLGFLGKYNGFINWASFLLAFSIYFYYRLSPLLSYLMLIVSLLFCFVVVMLEKLHASSGWPPMWEVCLSIFVLSWIGQFAGHKAEGKKPSFIDDIKFLLIGPVWLIHFILIRYKIRY